MISNYVVECVFCEENRKPRQAIVTVPATTQLLAIEKCVRNANVASEKLYYYKQKLKKKLF